MSMCNYGVSLYGMSLNHIPGVSRELLEDLADRDKIEYQFSFTGEAVKLSDEGLFIWNSTELYNDETVYYIEIPKCPTLFKPAYTNMDECVKDISRIYNQIPGLPKLGEDDVRKYLRLFQGTYYG